MKIHKKGSLLLTLLIFIASGSQAQNANTALSNLAAPTSVNQDLLPVADSIINFGAAAKSWKNIYFRGIIYNAGNKFISALRNNTFIGMGAGNNPGTVLNNDYNTATGYQSLYLNGGRYNTANGYSAMYQGGGNFNTAMGANALYSNSASYNTAVGYQGLYSNSTGGFNTAVGSKSMNTNNTGSNNTATGFQTLFYNISGSSNTATGFNALQNNTTGNYNTANGEQALLKNTTGQLNTATGNGALYNNTYAEQNTAMGSYALYSNTSGNYNTAVGSGTLGGNSTGIQNTAIGAAALYANNTGGGNTVVGSSALYNNTSGQSNTAIGLNAMNDNTTGSCNTAVGAGTCVNNLTYATAIGVGATATASYQVMLGSTSVSSVKAAGSFVIYSDGRFKKNVRENVPGLEFIKQLRPVTYNYDIHGLNNYIGIKDNSAKDEQAGPQAAKQTEDAIKNKEKRSYTGFIAQEVEAAAQKTGYDFSGVYKPQNDKDPYGLSYSDFVVPLVKAVQELSKQNDEKDTMISGLQQQLNELKTIVQSLVKGTGINATNSPALAAGTTLAQNTPNPFNQSTSIRYNLSSRFGSAKIIITDQAGHVLKNSTLTMSNGILNIEAGSLSAGTYNYSLIVDGRTIDTKKMIVLP